MKKILSIVVLLLFGTSTTALAQPMEPYRPYFGVRVGAGYTKSGGFDDVTPIIGMSFGVYVLNDFRLEGEYNYRFKAEDSGAHLRTQTFMLNGYYDFRNPSRITPFLGLGLGLAYWDAGRSDDLDLAIAGMFGASYTVDRHVLLEGLLKYTYYDADKGVNNLDLLLGVRYRF